jgi:murein DD-endopeptidase MepM/ murein hydrolase activator NlpD
MPEGQNPLAFFHLRDVFSAIGLSGMRPARNRFPSILALLLTLCLVAPSAFAAAPQARVNLADGFDFPVGKPNADGYYKSRGLRLRSPQHFGEDWNGRGGGDSDLGDPVYAIADGIVTLAANVRTGWGNVVLTRHAYRDPSSGQVKYIDTLNGHLDRIMVRTGQLIKRGQQIGTIGTNFGMYPAHLHFEIRHNIHIGMARSGVPSDLVNWADPTQFINKYRKLNREWRPVAVPTGTYKDYNGAKGL